MTAKCHSHLTLKCTAWSLRSHVGFSFHFCTAENESGFSDHTEAEGTVHGSLRTHQQWQMWVPHTNRQGRRWWWGICSGISHKREAWEQVSAVMLTPSYTGHVTAPPCLGFLIQDTKTILTLVICQGRALRAIDAVRSSVTHSGVVSYRISGLILATGLGWGGRERAEGRGRKRKRSSH